MSIKRVALYKHWLTADSVKQFITAEVQVGPNSRLPPDLLKAAQHVSSFQRLLVWYALLYVVIEGYRELELGDPDIDELLVAGQFADALCRLRNALFHYQADALSDKLLRFLTEPESEIWPRRLNSAFERYFRQHLSIDELVAQLKASEGH